MQNVLLTIGAVAVTLTSSIGHAGTFIPLPMYPGSVSTTVEDINNANVIVGEYLKADGTVHGFVGGMDGSYTSFDAPNPGYTHPRSINDAGYITGWGPATGDHVFGDAFLRKPDGKVVPITRDGAIIDGQSTGIRQSVQYVGESWYYDPDNFHFYTYGFFGKGSKWRSELTLPFNTDSTRPRGYNRAKTVAGYFRDLDAGKLRGFVLAGDLATVFDDPDPDAFGTETEGINDKGIISGNWYTVNDTEDHSFLFNPKTAKFKDITFPGADRTFAAGINNADLVAVDVIDDVTGDDTPYIYCFREKACPKTANAIHVLDKWRPAPAGYVHRVTCRNGCVSKQRVLPKGGSV